MKKESNGGKQKASDSRRRFMKGAVAASGATLLTAMDTVGNEAHAAPRWDHEFDIVVVGGGTAGSVAAVTAAEAGNKVVILESASFFGGTSSKAAGSIWIPNNRFMREKGLVDSRGDALRYMARTAYPSRYLPDDAQFGLPAHEFGLLEAFYDNGAMAIDFLGRIGALNTVPFDVMDYMEYLSEDKAPHGRHLMPRTPEGYPGSGVELMRQLRAAAEKRKIPILLEHRVTGVLRSDRGKVAGVEATTFDGSKRAFRARKAVIFGSGGFTHNLELMRNFQPAPTYGACALPTSQGDFLVIGQTLGAKLANLSNAWRAQFILDQALQFHSLALGSWMMPGDSMIMVNKYGDRVVNEKRPYNDRTRVHFEFDPSRNEYRNQFLFMVWDRRTADLFGGNFPIPTPPKVADYLISGQTFADLGRAIQDRLDRFAPRVGPVRLADDFGTRLEKTVMEFNGFATTGTDERFRRGFTPFEKNWPFIVPRAESVWPKTDSPNPTMHAFQSKGPYHAVILVAGTLDTNGGPVTNASAQILHANGQPIPGLYGAGNCIASPAGETYFGAGTTLGLAVAFGYIAGVNAAKEPVKAAPTRFVSG